ncbi:urea carboxylase [Terrimicrobium sacchariphilum]|uniref:Urea carboxylase n=1 Tax=Terrimicrobium sacchariphilum TaxID=690879 RepID=A0A146G801_TERSA|nr:urea carboxylase [Terrimicrobium sacchariphilum]GAT32848.1 urea carboxylase [Terrimicrobium sacchariphilum]
MFTKVLIANRGEIACRIIRTLDRLGVASVAVYSEADAHAAHVRLAGEAVCVGPAQAAQSYLLIDRILDAAKQTGAQAIHPGYGFLSENPEFAEACEKAGIAFIGPTAGNMRDFGLKHTARALAIASGVPVSPGTELLASVDEAREAAARIGYPVMLKSTAGGGGIGMQLARSEDELAEKFASVERMARSSFKESGLFLEKFIEAARHVEVQIFGDGEGTVAVLGERDCSVQRRNQKVIEETPAPHLSEEVRQRLHLCAKGLGEAAKYRSAGTCEFIYDANEEKFYFLEVNTRLQVEHCVTEQVSGLDLVEWMVRLAAGEKLPLEAYRHEPKGHSVQARVYAEDPNKNFQPSCGLLTEVSFPAGVRVDGWVERGSEVTPYYDPMIAKVISHAATREEAIVQLEKALAASRVDGIETNIDYLGAILGSREFLAGGVTTKFLSTFPFTPRTIDVLEPGTHTTVQDYPGRTGYWEIGVPPSGPMDHLAFRLANWLVGNDEKAAGLECTVTGPKLKFHRDARVAVTGADMQPEIDGVRQPMWEAFDVKAGQTLKLYPVAGGGCRAYLAVAGGFDVPDYLGSKATFTLGQFGGHGGRILRAGDVLKMAREVALTAPRRIAEPPIYSNSWNIAVMYGPHGAPDFFTPEDIETFFASDWKVHYNSSRTGIRLIGPKPKWARPDGGEAGLHPSNIHDNAYAIGAVDFTGDMPVILAVDGPSLGGFVCPVTIIQAEFWKMGQLRPGDTVKFVPTTVQAAVEAELALDNWTTEGEGRQQIEFAPADLSSDRLLTVPEEGELPQAVYRAAGDKYLLVEYGPLVLDLNLRFRVHALMTALVDAKLPGVLDITPGIRSLQIHYDSRVLSLGELIDALSALENALPSLDDLEVPTRIVRLPLSWDDPATQLAIDKYAQSVRKDAPWCPSNIEFIRRINGLSSIEEVKEIVFSASYLVMGLGDVYLGAPVATPLDPRHRLVTTKYNPARTWTPENAVGIGGAYLCVYGMEGPGGYQFVGRTVQMWNRWRQTADFAQPWLLRHFDQIQFYPVSAEELLRMREEFPQGKLKLDIREERFRLGDYRKFLSGISDEAAKFKATQQQAFNEERERWALAGSGDGSAADTVEEDAPEPLLELAEGSHAIDSHVAANVWKVCVEPGAEVAEGETLMILEAMKMEIAIVAPLAGTVEAIRCAEGQMVMPGQTLAVIAEK